MTLNYRSELNNILEKVYLEMTYTLLINNFNTDFSNSNIDELKSTLSNSSVYLGNELNDFIVSCMSGYEDEDLFRCEISKYHDKLYPIFTQNKSITIQISNYNKFALLLWREHMNDLLISDVQSLFTKDSFKSFVNNRLEYFIDILNTRIENYRSQAITINFERKEDLLDILKEMILNEELDFNYAYLLVDLDKLRDDMVKAASAFHIYNEFDKLENETKYCLDNYCKYTSEELFDVLINEENFIVHNNNTLIKKMQ